MQNKADFLAKAERLAGFIFSQTRSLRFTPLKDTGFGGWLSLLKLSSDFKNATDATKIDYHALIPMIHELIIFGSVAEGVENPNDIDLMMFDNGHFSDFFVNPTDDEVLEESSDEFELFDWYEHLRDNLSWLMSGWFGVEEDVLHEMLGDVPVDLHVLPIRFLGSREFRKEIMAKHKDPDFFWKVFKNAKRFNPVTGHFETLTLEYFEKKYNCDLSDLR